MVLTTHPVTAISCPCSQDLRQENEKLIETNKELEKKSNSSSMNETQRQELTNLHTTLTERIREISILNENIKTIIHTS